MNGTWLWHIVRLGLLVALVLPSLAQPPAVATEAPIETVQPIPAAGIDFSVIDTDQNRGDGTRIYSPGNHIVRDSAGHLYVAYTLRTTQFVPWYNYFRRSEDGGSTWSNAVRTDSMPDSSSVQSLAIDGAGTLYQGFTFNVGSFFTKSSDRGETWANPVALHDGGWGAWDYMPSVVVDAQGKLHAVYMSQYGWNSPPSNLLYKHSDDGGTTWSDALGLTQHPQGSGDYGVRAPNMYVGKDGWLFAAYVYLHTLSGDTYNPAYMLVYYDGEEWGEALQVSTAGQSTIIGGDIAVDSTGLLHMVWQQREEASAGYALLYRTFNPATKTLSAVRTLAPAQENVYNVTMGIYAEDKLVVAYDRHTQTGNSITYHGVYVRTSEDDFAAARQVSTHPNAYAPNLRSSFTFMRHRQHEDLIWVEPNEDPIPGESIVYADISGLPPPVPPTAGLLVNTFVTKIVNPGQVSPVVVSYRNRMEEAARGAVLLLNLPEGLPLQSCSGDYYYHRTEHQVSWNLGDLAPNAQGRFVCWLSIPWGMTDRKVQVLARLDAENSGMPLFNLEHYRGATPNPVVEERYLEQRELAQALANPAVRELHDLALQRGFSFSDVGQQIRHRNGEQTRVLVYTRFAPFALMLLLEQDGKAFMIHQNDDQVEFLDPDGGLIMNSHTGNYHEYGAWSLASEQQALPDAQLMSYQFTATYGTCLRNCMISKGAMVPVDAAIDTVTAPFKAAWGAIKVTYNVVRRDAEGVAKDVLDALPYKNVTQRAVELVACRSTCADNPHEYDCGGGNGAVGKQWCEGNLRYRHYCAGMRMWRPSSVWFNCTMRGEVCLDGECVTDACRILPGLDQALLEREAAPTACLASNEPSSCKSDEMEIVPAHDPNTKAVSPAGDILPGELLTYTIEFENEGAGIAYDVFIIDELDEHLDETTLIMSHAGTYNAELRQASWLIGEVAPGAGGIVTMTVRARAGLPTGTLITNQAVVHFPSAFEETPTDLVVSTINTLVAEPQALEVVGSAALNLRLAGREASGLSPTYALASNPRYGSLSGDLPNLVYEAMPGFSGIDEFTFVAQHNGVSSRPARVSIRVHPDPADQTRPSVLQTFPAADATQVRFVTEAVSEQPVSYLPMISVHFSKPMDRASLTNALSVQGLVGRLHYDEQSRTLYYTPMQSLRPQTTYTATLAGSVADQVGNQLGQSYRWQFTTAAAAAIQVSLPHAAEELVFPALDAGSPRVTQIIQITNQGYEDLTLEQVQSIGPHADAFRLVDDRCSGMTLPSLAGCTLQVQYEPDGFGLHHAMLRIPSNDSLNPTVEIAMRNTAHTLYLPLVRR
ncbi:Ig-like domain-containing protein [Candidatus Viridilinea mediisalina]|uniref:DUF11 domain-containing protein n=1 Tax=Candidatus Viridilinea mediisalina TaxID=2024553 RepID=A0A2A6RPA7_9CHLR|nr:Ig-like domain-containing protein [Candidatus Viridilinea mediisalina]PDW04699.1 hypothetical protein CJ255_02040 [Candidatus Viridilinea mediisalina]